MAFLKKNRRFAAALFAALLFLSSCTAGENPNARIAAVRNNRDLFLEAVRHMESFGFDRLYVAFEEKEEETTQTATGETEKKAAEIRLVS